MNASAYRRAIAECLREAAAQGIVESRYRIGSGGRKVCQDATQMSAAFYLVDKLVESPYWTYEPRLFVALAPLQPELGKCVTELRRLLEVEQHVARGEAILGRLQRRVKFEQIVALSESTRELL